MTTTDIAKAEVLGRLKGYSSQLRQDFLLLKLGLSDSALIMFRLLTEVFTDWDQRHLKYGLFVFDADKISYITGWSQAKTLRIFNWLRKSGLAKQIDKKNKLYEIIGYKERLPLVRQPAYQPISDGLAYLDYLDSILSQDHGENSSLKTQQNFTLLKKTRSQLWDVYSKLKKEFTILRNQFSEKTASKGSNKRKFRFSIVSSKGKSSFNSITPEDKTLIDSILKDTKK